MNKDLESRLLRLISRLNENRLTENEFEELMHQLRTDEDARRRYCRMQHQESFLLNAASSVSENKPFTDLRFPLNKFRSEVHPFRSLLKIAAIGVVTTLLVGGVSRLLEGMERSKEPAVAVLRSEGSQHIISLRPGTISLPEGEHILDFYSGAQMQVQGPAVFNILDSMTVKVEHARIAANVSRDAKGFRLELKGASFVDLGTEFAVDVQQEQSSLKVYKGEVLANTTNTSGSTVRSLLATPSAPLRFDREQNRYDAIEQTEVHDFTQFQEISTPPLPDLTYYRGLIQQAQPNYYWDFDTLDAQGFIDIESGRRLEIRGKRIGISRNRSNGAVLFTPDDEFHMLKLDGEMQFLKNQPFTIEFLFCPDRIRVGTLISLFEEDSVETNGSANHFIIVETMARQNFFSHIPGAIRAAYRPVPSGRGLDGINAFSNRQYLPGEWLHFAMTFDGKTLRTYCNSQLQNTLTLNPEENPKTGNYAMVLGQVSSSEEREPPSDTYRPFVGSIDELAIYHRELKPAEIQQHFKNTGL